MCIRDSTRRVRLLVGDTRAGRPRRGFVFGRKRRGERERERDGERVPRAGRHGRRGGGGEATGGARGCAQVQTPPLEKSSAEASKGSVRREPSGERVERSDHAERASMKKQTHAEGTGQDRGTGRVVDDARERKIRTSDESSLLLVRREARILERRDSRRYPSRLSSSPRDVPSTSIPKRPNTRRDMRVVTCGLWCPFRCPACTTSSLSHGFTGGSNTPCIRPM